MIGGVYYALPRILNCELYGRRLASAQWVLFVIGFSFFFIGFTLAGLVQGSNWVKQGLPVWEVLPGIRAYMAMRIFGGSLMFGSFLMMPIIVIGTLAKRVPNTEPHFSFGRQRKAAPDAGARRSAPPSRGWSRHEDDLQDRPLVGGLVGFFAVVTWVVFPPTALWKPQRTIIAQGYQGDVARGRTLFFSNGCNYCHTQYVREQDDAMGPVSQGGNYNYDNPMILGSERTGPDLSYIGRKRSQQWEIDHLEDPRDYSPLSIMPRLRVALGTGPA